MGAISSGYAAGMAGGGKYTPLAQGLSQLVQILQAKAAETRGFAQKKELTEIGERGSLQRTAMMAGHQPTQEYMAEQGMGGWEQPPSNQTFSSEDLKNFIAEGKIVETNMRTDPDGGQTLSLKVKPEAAGTKSVRSARLYEGLPSDKEGVAPTKISGYETKIPRAVAAGNILGRMNIGGEASYYGEKMYDVKTHGKKMDRGELATLLRRFQDELGYSLYDLVDFLRKNEINPAEFPGLERY